MIQANELRIGNYLLYDEDGNWTTQKIVYIGKDTEGYDGYFVHFGWASTTIQDHFKDGDISVKPIPLTPEILAKFSQRVSQVSVKFRVNLPNETCLFIRLEEVGNDPVWEIMIFKFGSSFKLASYKYLHQLQNLYFALTGTELTPTL